MTPARRIRLIVLLEDLDFGGTQRYVTHLLKHLDRTRFEPELWTLRGGREFLDDIRASGICMRHMSIAGRVWPWALVHLAWSLIRRRPDMIYTLTVLPNIWGRVFAGMLGIPVVSGYRNLRPRQHERILHRFSRQIIANAASLKRNMISWHAIPPERISVVANGVDIEHFTPDQAAAQTEPIVLCIARRVRQKDMPTLIRAFEMTLLEVPEARLRIVGNGPVEIPAHPAVEVLAAGRDIRPYLASARIFALSSVDEGSPNAILEAMAAGLPVAATAVGGVPELVEDGTTGILVPPGDAKALSEALTQLLRDHNLNRRMGAAGRQRACAAFSLTSMVRQTEQVLIDALGEG